ncbi:MAG: hypothetical protein MZW92_40370 [Comamonadaceae bacterium]|nr:hypothetical protein [Comamonadaceae bacterium]
MRAVAAWPTRGRARGPAEARPGVARTRPTGCSRSAGWSVSFGLDDIPLTRRRPWPTSRRRRRSAWRPEEQKLILGAVTDVPVPGGARPGQRVPEGAPTLKAEAQSAGSRRRSPARAEEGGE